MREEARLSLEGCDRKSVATIERIARGGASKGWEPKTGTERENIYGE